MSERSFVHLHARTKLRADADMHLLSRTSPQSEPTPVTLYLSLGLLAIKNASIEPNALVALLSPFQSRSRYRVTFPSAWNRAARSRSLSAPTPAAFQCFLPGDESIQPDVCACARRKEGRKEGRKLPSELARRYYSQSHFLPRPTDRPTDRPLSPASLLARSARTPDPLGRYERASEAGLHGSGDDDGLWWAARRPI